MNDTKSSLTVKSAFASLQAAGYPAQYIKRLLPEWWDNSLLKTSSGALQFALIMKQRLGLTLKFDQSGELIIEPGTAHTNFKHRADTDIAELNIVAGLGIALARVASSATERHYKELPLDPQQVYKLTRDLTGRSCVDFEGLLDVCWAYGIPVLYLNDLPRHAKRMAGMATMIQGRPVIVLGSAHKRHSQQLFVLAHELAHILCGHVQNNDTLVDEDIGGVGERLEWLDKSETDEQEREADYFALQLLRNGQTAIINELPRGRSSARLAAAAMSLGRKAGIDAGHLLLSYAKEHDDWKRAGNALNFTLQQSSAIDVLKDRFYDNVNLTMISDEAASYLIAMQGFEE